MKSGYFAPVEMSGQVSAKESAVCYLSKASIFHSPISLIKYHVTIHRDFDFQWAP